MQQHRMPLTYADPLAAPPFPVHAGQVLAGRYRVGQLLGAGGMGLVFEGQHLTLGISVAIKLVRPQFASDAHVMQRFINEARGVASLTSPHVARVFDAGQLDSGEAYLVMEHLVGQDLLAHIREWGPLDWKEAALYVAQACDGLADAHERGLVHRDIKPEHLFIVQTEGAEPYVKVLDFGIAKRLGLSSEDRMTDPGDSIGSPSYMSPEQVLDASNVDARTDIWSLGVVLYEALTTVRPFDGDTIGHTQWQILDEPPEPLSALRPDVPPGLVAIVSRCLEKDRDRRFASVRQLGDELKALLRSASKAAAAPPHSGSANNSDYAVEPLPFLDTPLDTTPLSERSSENWQGPQRFARRRRVLRVLVGLFVGALAALLVWGVWQRTIALWPAHLNTDDTSVSDTDRSWEPAMLPLVKLETGDGVSRDGSIPPTTSIPEQDANSLTPDRPPTDQPDAPKRSSKAQTTDLTPDQIEARYRRWLEQQNLVPVDEVTVDRTGTLSTAKPEDQ